jgi:ankyrin repeat protein
VCSLLVKHASVTPQHARFAVCRAAAGNHLKVMKLLVTSRPDASSPTLFGSPMADAASAGSIEGMQLLMQHGADLRNAPDTAWRCYTRRSTRLLYRAARGGHLPAVRWLLSQGFSKAKVAEAFVGAVEGGHAAIARLLLEHNPCISTHGPMALRAAVCRHDVPIIQLLLEAGVFTQKAWLMRTTGLRSAKDMLDWAGNCMRQLNSDQATALLSTAIEYGHTDFAKLLLEARKAINQKSTIELKAAALKMGDAQLCQMIAM